MISVVALFPGEETNFRQDGRKNPGKVLMAFFPFTVLPIIHLVLPLGYNINKRTKDTGRVICVNLRHPVHTITYRSILMIYLTAAHKTLLCQGPGNDTGV